MKARCLPAARACESQDLVEETTKMMFGLRTSATAHKAAKSTWRGLAGRP